MNYYPIFLRVAGRPCVVIGGGIVAEEKIDSLLKAGARVTVISPQLTSRLSVLAATNQIAHTQRLYARGDLTGFFLACAATDDDSVHAQIAADAATAGVLLNVADRPPLCDFIMPSVMERGDLVIATSTGGASPAMAKRIQRELATIFGPEYALALVLLRRVRECLAGSALTSTERQRVFKALVDSPLLDYLLQGRARDVDELLALTVGDDVSLASLGIDLTDTPGLVRVD